MLDLTLDTSCVIHAAQRQEHGARVDRLVELAIKGQVSLALTAAYWRDQETNTAERTGVNLAWLERHAPVLGAPALPGPFRLDYSRLDGPDVLASDDISQLGATVSDILRPKKQRHFHDVQHLLAHSMAGRDAFVTEDKTDMVNRSARLWSEAGIRVWTLARAVLEAEAAWHADGTAGSAEPPGI